MLREGITLRNPFRFVFEELPRPAPTQPLLHENLPWAQVRARSRGGICQL